MSLVNGNKCKKQKLYPLEVLTDELGNQEDKARFLTALKPVMGPLFRKLFYFPPGFFHAMDEDIIEYHAREVMKAEIGIIR